MVDFDVCQNATKLIGYHSNVPFVSFVIPIHVTIYTERLVKIGLVDIRSDMPIFAVSSKKVQLLPSGVTGTNVSKIV